MKDWLETFWFLYEHSSKVYQLKEIAAARRIPVSTARGHLKGLIRLGLVKQQGYGHYCFNPTNRDALEIARVALEVVKMKLSDISPENRSIMLEAQRYLDAELKKVRTTPSVLRPRPQSRPSS